MLRFLTPHNKCVLSAARIWSARMVKQQQVTDKPSEARNSQLTGILLPWILFIMILCPRDL